MTGVEFLEQAMDVFPRARRALLTAYADTDAAIRAINVVDVDHYLLKPWDPPEEKLYPVDRRAARRLEDDRPTARSRAPMSSCTARLPVPRAA
jgi:thioredoxin reductase (NADPH)